MTLRVLLLLVLLFELVQLWGVLWLLVLLATRPWD
jgi:hypothetical protein